MVWGRCGDGCGDGIAGFSLSDTSVHLLSSSCGSVLGRRASTRRGVGERCAGAVRAAPPVDDLRLVDLKAVVVARDQARRVPDGAVDVGDRSAGPADHVVVVVAGPGLV